MFLLCWFFFSVGMREPQLFCHACLEGSVANDTFLCPHCSSTLVEVVDVGGDHELRSWYPEIAPTQRELPTLQLPSLHDLLRREIDLLRTPERFGGFGDAATLRELMHRTLVEHHPLSQGVEPNVVNSFERTHVGLKGGDSSGDCSCVICQESMREDAAQDRFLNLIRLPCGHWFHDFCIGPWLDQCQTCPICRRNVVQ